MQDIYDEIILKDTKAWWDEQYKSYSKDKIAHDDWLKMFEEIIITCDTPIIDLGCGTGNDIKCLLEYGKKVIPCDYSEDAIKSIQMNFSDIEIAKCFDMKEKFPFEDDFTSLIVADLSLHYFSEKDTERILNEIKRVLKKDGILIFRVNSIKEEMDGELVEVEEHFYQTIEGYKRFFDEDDIKRFFEDWEIIFAQEERIIRYEKVKQLWKVAVKVKK